jgi:hypothetical protein
MRIVGVSLWLALSFACKKDESVSACLQLEGTWNCTSWKEDGEEFLGDTAFIASNTLTFKELTDNQGDYTWDITYLVGGSENIIGAYTVNASCDEVVITPKAGSPSTYAFSISGDQLILEGTNNGILFEMEFGKQ